MRKIFFTPSCVQILSFFHFIYYFSPRSKLFLIFLVSFCHRSHNFLDKKQQKNIRKRYEVGIPRTCRLVSSLKTFPFNSVRAGDENSSVISFLILHEEKKALKNVKGSLMQPLLFVALETLPVSQSTLLSNKLKEISS